MFEEYEAPAGQTWVCDACGKQSQNRYRGNPGSTWDESCGSWAVLCDTTSIVLGDDGRVMKADAAAIK
jgi:hypothetical protein